MRRKLNQAIFASAAIFFLLLPAIAQAQLRLNTAYPAISGGMAAPWIAYEEGLFKKNGLDVSMGLIAGGARVISAILSGDNPISLAGGDALVQARLRGADLVSIADHAYTFVFSLMTSPNIKNPEDLRGKKLGILNFGGSTDLALIKVIEHYKLRPVQDVAVLAIGGIPEILASIQSGRIDGGILSPPTSIRAKKLGLHEFLDLGTLQIPFQQTTVITTERYSRSNPEVVRAYVKSFVEAIHLGKTNKNLAKRVISKYTKVTDDETLEDTYQLFVVKYLKEAPYPSEAAIKTVLDYVGEKDPKARTARPKDFVEPRWVKELEDSGYIGNLYKK